MPITQEEDANHEFWNSMVACSEGTLVPMAEIQEAYSEFWMATVARAAHTLLEVSDPTLNSSPDQDGYYDSSHQYWPDAHKYIASDTDEVLKLIDDTLRR